MITFSDVLDAKTNDERMIALGKLTAQIDKDARREEREACAKVADKITKELTDYGTLSYLAKSAGWKIAAVIRARSDENG